jgi:hypothetical protein
MHLEVSRHFLYFSDMRQTRCARKIPEAVLETTFITKATTHYLDFKKYFVVSFSVLLEDSLKIISET